MDNQQASQTEIGWLAGIIDGEGYLGLSVAKELRTKAPSQQVTPMMHICNTDEAIILRTKDILNKLGIKGYCRVHNNYGASRKVVYKVQIKRQKALKVLLDCVGEHLTGNKKERAKLMLEYCNSRIQRYVKGTSCPHSNRELELVEACLPLQRRGASETIRKMQLRQSEILKEQRQRIHKMALKEKFICDNCGKEFTAPRSRRSYHQHIFCSLDNLGLWHILFK